MELEDFTQQKLSMEDFEIDGSTRELRIPVKSAATIAAGETILDEEPTLDNYRKTRESLLSHEGRKAFLLRHESRRNQILRSYEQELQEVLLDPEIPDAQKQMFVEGVRNAPNAFQPSANDIIVEQALLASNEGETETTAVVRLDMVDMVDEVNAHKRGVISEVNAVRAIKNPSLVSTAVDLAEIFVPFAEWNDVDMMYRELVGDGAILMGTQRAELFKVVEKMPYNKRAELTEGLINYIEEHDQIIFPDGNDLVALDTLNQILVDDNYSDLERWFDNTVSVLEFTGLLAVAAKTFKVGKTLKRITRSDVSQTSPSQLIKDVNPDQARNQQIVAGTDETGEGAEGLYGANQTEAVAKELLPEPEIEVGRVENKVVAIEPEELTHLRTADGQTYLSKEEVERVRTKVVEDFTDVEGMMPHKESMVIRTNDNGTLGINVMYRPRDSGFRTPEAALENAKFALRKYGVDDEHLTLYRREGSDWVETGPRELRAREILRVQLGASGMKIPSDLKGIDYAVGLKYDYTFSPTDLQGYDVLSINKIFGLLPSNVLDRLPPGMSKAGQGSLTQNMLDASSVLHPQIVEPALVATDKGVALKKAYVGEFENFTKGYSKLKQDRRAMMTNYINQANQDGVAFNVTDLKSRGFDNHEVGILKTWRNANDIMFHAMNDDMAKTLRNRGFQMYTNSTNDTRLLVKPMKRGSVGAKTSHFDVSSGKVKVAKDTDELDELYEAGGSYAQLSEPIKVGEEWVDVVRVDGTADAGYMRAIKANERVLKYRDGYYPVMYDANFFIQKTVKGADGEEFVKTIASAKNTEDLNQMLKMLRTDDPKSTFTSVKDRRADSERASGFDEMGWSLGVSSGMTAQRVRGERLLDAGTNLHKIGSSNLIDPLEAVSQQISQLSRRVSMRQYMDTTKQRWIDNYAKLLGLEPDRTGTFRFPSDISQVKAGPEVDKQLVADARSLFNYVHGLENGYINGIDFAWKAGFEFGADLLAKAKWSKSEEKLRDWGKGTLTGSTKGAVFKMYLAANPARQLIIQGHQTIQLGAINPKYIVGPMQTDLYRLGRAMRGYEGDAEAVTMLRELRNSGMLDAVDANNLIRQDMLRLADLTVTQKLQSAAKAPLRVAQVVGFDTAERFVLVTSWLAHRDMAVKAGKTLDRRGWDEVAGKARSFTYAMNRAGDMPYNENSLNIIAQFLQVPHKAFLQPLTNSSLTPRQRAQLFTWNTVIYGGIPAGVIHDALGENIPEGTVKDTLAHGLEDVLLNSVASMATGEEQQVDWGDLNPNDLHGMSDTLLSLWTSGLGQALVDSPSGSLFYGHNPRVTNLYNTAARWVHLKDDYVDPELDTKYTDVAIAAANLFSGYSNTFKTRYTFKTGTKVSSLGNISDEDVTKFEASMQFFGFRTQHEEGTRKIREGINKDKSFSENDVQLWYSELKRQLARKGLSVREKDMAQRILTEGQRVFRDDPPKFQDSLFNLIKNDVEKSGYNIFEDVIAQMGWKTKGEMLDLIDQLPNSEQKKILRKSILKLGE